MDENVHNDIDRIFKDPLQSHPDKPSDVVWARIEQQLDKDDTLLYKARSRFLLRVCACLLLLIIASGTFIYIQHNHGFSRQQHVTQEPTVNQGVFPGAITSGVRQNTGNMTEQPSGVAALDKKSSTINKAGTYPPKSPAKNKAPAISYMAPALYTVASRDVPGQSQNEKAPLFVHSVSPSLPIIKSTSFKVGSISIPPARADNDKKTIRLQKPHITNRFSVTPYYSKEFAGYNLSDDDATAPNGSEIEKKERNVFSASAGIYLNYTIKKRWVIQSGLSYSWSGSILNPSESFAVKAGNGDIQFRVNTESGYGYLPPSSSMPPIVGDSVLTGNVYSNLHYISVPLIVSYKFDLHRFTLLAGAGATLNFLASATVKTTLYGPSFSQNECVVAMNGLKKVNYGVLVKAELQYHINSNWGVIIMPCFKNTLSPINIHSAVSAYPYNVGVGLGVNYRL